MYQVAVCDWRDPAPYAALIRCGRPGLAWELLRRDLGYRSAVRDLGTAEVFGRNGVVQLPVTDAAFTARWGLHFR